MYKKTNAMRLLDKNKVVYRVIEYEVNEDNLNATHVAGSVGLPTGQVFKTLVARGDKTDIIVAVIPGDKELDLKALAKVSGNKSVAMLALKEVLPVTGYIRGGVSPLGMKKLYPTYIDEKAKVWVEISISSGLRGYQIVLAPSALVMVVLGAQFVKISS